MLVNKMEVLPMVILENDEELEKNARKAERRTSKRLKQVAKVNKSIRDSGEFGVFFSHEIRFEKGI